MQAIWGSLDRIEADQQGRYWVQLKAILSGKTTIRFRALVGKHTLIARGVERIDLTNLCAGELLEVSFRHGRDGFLEAETIYAQPERVPAA
ncbi:MAG TPA: hypothetical protein VLE03_02645 [Nitrospiraceae bacterium]|nr:hypothetical protein [Nitrospiraceae bacterium]